MILLLFKFKLDSPIYYSQTSNQNGLDEFKRSINTLSLEEAKEEEVLIKEGRQEKEGYDDIKEHKWSEIFS